MKIWILLAVVWLDDGTFNVKAAAYKTEKSCKAELAKTEGKNKYCVESILK